MLAAVFGFEWATLADMVGVLGFVIAGGHIAVRWWRDRLKLRLQFVSFPDGWQSNYGFIIHHDAGPSFRVEKVELVLFNNATGGETPIELDLSGIDNDNHDCPLFAAGESLRCEARGPNYFPTILRTEGRTGLLRIYSQGKLVKEWNISSEIRAARERSRPPPTSSLREGASAPAHD